MIGKTPQHTLYFEKNKSKSSSLALQSYLRTLIHTVFVVFAAATSLTVQAQSCDYIGVNGGQSISAEISINGTSTQVTNGMWVPRGSTLRIDAVAQAYGSCTGMGWTNTTPPSCEPTGFVWQRTPNHIYVSVDIGALNGNYAVGNVWGLNPDMHVLDTHSADTTGPAYLWLYYTGSYKLHIFANINTPCDLTPSVTEELTLTVNVGDDDGATDFGVTSCNSNVGKPVNVTNGNVYLQQTDYRLPGIGDGLEITRTFNSRMKRAGFFGYGWSSILDESISGYDALTLRLNLPDGRAVYFTRPSASDPFAPARPLDFHGVIVKNVDNTYTLTFKDGRVHQFNTDGTIVSYSDRNNNIVSLTYTAGKPTAIADAAGRTVTITYDGSGYIGSLSDSTGTIATYTHWFWGIVTNVAYPDGSQFTFSGQFDGTYFLPSTVTDALNNVVESHTYDAHGRALTSEIAGNGTEKYTLNYVSATETDVTDALNHVTKYSFDTTKGRNVVTSIEGSCSCGGSQIQSWSYDAQLNVTAKTDALSHTTSYTYDTNGNRLTQTDATGTITYTYNSLGDVLTVTDQMSGVWTNTYDAHSNLLTAKDPLNKTTTMTFNSQGQLLTVTDPRNNATTFTYDTNGNLTRRTDALNNQTNIAYDARGRVTSVTNALSEVTSYEYDALGRLKKIIYPDTNFVQFTYDLAGRRTKIKDPRGNETTFAYDAAYRLTSETNADNKTTSYEYDSRSNLTGVADTLNRTTNYFYDEQRRLTKIKYPEATSGAGRFEENFGYDLAGNLITKTDQAGRVTTFCYDNANRLTSTIDPAQKTTAYEFNGRSQLTAVVDAINQRYEFAYDPLGRVTQNKKGTATMSFVYDAAGNRSQRTDYNAAVTNYSYDALNRLTTISYPDTTSAIYGYDVLSRVTTATNPTGTVTIAYDNRSRVSSVTDVFGQVVSYQYDPNSNRTQLNLNGSTNATYQYDVINRLTQLTDNASLNTTFAYDATNKLTSRTLPNGVISSYQYDDLNRLTRLTHAKASNTLADFQYQFNAVNNITQIIDIEGTHNYTYDSLDRLTAAMHPSQINESYTYDDVGNRTASHQGSSYSYQPFNRLTAENGTSLGYDANGSLISKTDANGTWNYTWDYENRLKQAAFSSGLAVTYNYDALGRRIQRTSSTAGTTRFVFDGGDIVRDLDRNGSIVAEYLNGIGIDSKLRETTSESISYFVTDQLATTRSLTDGTGNTVGVISYDSFGKIISGPTQTRYSYTGREIDLETDLMFYRARWYSPQEGRFIAEDPIGFKGGDINLYGYVWRSPLNFRDPLGLDGWGNDAADWIDERIGYVRQYWQYCDQEWVANGVNNSVAEFAFGLSDLLRVGSGVGQALYAGDENGYGRAASVAQDVARASAIFSILAGTAAESITPSASTECCINSTPITDPGWLLPERAGPAGNISPTEVINKTPAEIDARAQQLGLQPRGPDPAMGRGSYIDPQTGTQRILSHPNATPPHGHVNNPAGSRIGPTGSVVRPNSPAAHLPIR